ncbi:MAG: SET domain-containing protein [Lacinutrix sp.]|uniref:SET domain-containing protein-lysine N-methyltransferase n=1 Tax=Lacinutrix sp. TaxID=1937692 RepID=UPI0030A62849
MYINTSQIEQAGKGLFTAITIYKNEIISLFKGEIITETEATKRIEHNNDRYFINILDGSIMDSQNTNCFAKYANDAQGLFTSKYKNNAKITLDDNGNVCLKATKKIKQKKRYFVVMAKHIGKNTVNKNYFITYSINFITLELKDIYNGYNTRT